VFETPTPSGSPSSLAVGTTTSSVQANTAVDHTTNTSERIGVTVTVGQITPSKPNTSESTILRLRREVEALKNAFASSQKRWSEERNSLLEELLRKREDFGDISTDMQILEAERARLSLLEEKIKEVLVMLRALNSTNISPKTLGRLVLDAVERSVEPLTNEIQVFKFLNNL
jgi:flagellar motility protein MotE (MotC chaperone)